MDESEQPLHPRVVYGPNQYGNVVVAGHSDLELMAFAEAIAECRTVTDVRRLPADKGGWLEGALESIDEQELGDEDLWDEEMMPGFGDGYWPPRYENGMAEFFTDEQVDYLIKNCGAEVVDSMGGIGEMLFIPESQTDRVGVLLREWGFDAVRAEHTLP